MIEGEADGIIREYPDSAAVARLAYLVGYLTKIVKTHLRSGER